MGNFFNKKVSTVLSNCSNKQKPYVFEFLTINEQEIVEIEAKKHPDLIVSFDGGIVNSEYKKAIIKPFEIEVNSEITILKISYNTKYLSLTHRVLLGTILHLGISRDRIGDIAINDGCAYIAVSDSISDFIISELTSICSQPVIIAKYYGKVEMPDNGIEKTIFVASNRLDSIMSSSYNMSREDSATLIEKEMVKVNQKIVIKSFQNLKPCDIISVAHKGRIKLLDISGTSRSGRIVMKVKIYR